MFTPALSQGGSISFYLSAAGAQSSSVAFANGASTSTEKFDGRNGSYTQYSSVVGNFNGNLLVQAADQYGGANSTSYMVFGSQNGSSSPVSLALNTPANYLGFWWSAGDANNAVTLYSGGSKLARISESDITSMLGRPSLTSLDGSSVSSQAYYCNPNNGSQDCGEPFAYLNIFAAGVTFDKLVLDNSGTSGSGFEVDNFTVANGTPILQNSFVSVGSQAVATPEPATLSMVLAGSVLVGCGVFRKLRR